MDRVAERARASKASLYRRWPGRAALVLDGIVGQAMRGVLGEALQNPDLAAEVSEFARGNASRMMREILANAVKRGECDPDLVTDFGIEAGPTLLRQRFIFGSGPIDDDFLVGVVDQVVLPLFGVDPKDNRRGT